VALDLKGDSITRDQIELGEAALLTSLTRDPGHRSFEDVPATHAGLSRRPGVVEALHPELILTSLASNANKFASWR